MGGRASGNKPYYVAVVDDDENVCRSVSRLLRFAGYHTITYNSAEALLEDSKKPKFDCLVLDVQLTGISGLELTDRLRGVRDTTPVVFVTGHDDANVKTRAMSLGCAGFFLKQDPAERVLTAIGKAVGVGADDAVGDAAQEN